MSSNTFSIRPLADRDLEDQAFYYAAQANRELGRRFLTAAHMTFTLLATQPNMGWRAKLREPDLEDLRFFRVQGFERILILDLPLPNGVDILRVVSGSQNLQALLLRKNLQ